jgi:hypothetical protein
VKLFHCTQCHLNPTHEWAMIRDMDEIYYHVGFDKKPCGPVLPIPAREKRLPND